MKRMLSIVITVCLVLVGAGNALAAFQYGANSSLAISITDMSTTEFGFDLGILDTDFAMTDQNVTLANAGDLNYVGNTVGIYSATSDFEMTFGLGVNVTPTTSLAQALNFQNTYRDIIDVGYLHTSPATVDGPGANGKKTYTKMMSGGNYAGLLSGIGPGYEVALDFTGGYTDVYMYTWDIYNSTLDSGNIIRLYQDGSAVLNPTAVPVPAAVWLLGSGLLGLIGIRRRNA